MTLVTTWFFQVYLLDYFYEKTKRSELRNAAEEIADNIENENLRDIALELAVDGSMRVLVVKVDDEVGIPLLDVDATGGMALYPDMENAGELLKRAYNRGGMYVSKVTFGGQEVPDRGPLAFFGDDDTIDTDKLQTENTRLICLKITKSQEGKPFLIVLNTALFPFDSTVRTLELQFIWIAIALAIVASLFIFQIYRWISKPLMCMCESAKQLAKGNYNTKFVGAGYLETHELADTLNYAATELSRVDMLQKELISNISHDLRTPLTMIKGYSELMRDIPGEMSPENMQIVIDETERLSNLVSDLLDLSQLQADSACIEMTEFNLTDAIRDVMRRYDAFIHHRGYRLTLSSEEDIWVKADRKTILQVLYNLINNAINYTGEDRFVLVEQTVLKNHVRISITDTGEGIAPEEMPLIWDRYYKIDKVHKRVMVGTGLGLSIVKGILEKHHAAYGVNSTVGVGSTFWFELEIISDTNTDAHTEE